LPFKKLASDIFIANLTSSLDLYYKNRPKLTQMQRHVFLFLVPKQYWATLVSRPLHIQIHWLRKRSMAQG
jgi:hypothetical protein